MEKLGKDMIRKIIFFEGGRSGLALSITCKNFYRMLSKEERLRLRDLNITTRSIIIRYRHGGLYSLLSVVCPNCNSTNGLPNFSNSWECLDCNSLFVLRKIEQIPHFKIPILYKHNCKKDGYCKSIDTSLLSNFNMSGRCYVKRSEYWKCEILRIEKYLAYPMINFIKFNDSFDVDNIDELGAFLDRLHVARKNNINKYEENPTPNYLTSYYNDPCKEMYPDAPLFPLSSLSSFSSLSAQNEKIHTLIVEENYEELRKVCEIERIKILAKDCICPGIEDIKAGRRFRKKLDRSVLQECGDDMDGHDMNNLYRLHKKIDLFSLHTSNSRKNDIYSKTVTYVVLYSYLKNKLYVKDIYFSKSSPHYKTISHFDEFHQSLTF